MYVCMYVCTIHIRGCRTPVLENDDVLQNLCDILITKACDIISYKFMRSRTITHIFEQAVLQNLPTYATLTELACANNQAS
jgi:hypothetical protein